MKIKFDTVNLGPSNILQIEGVTVTAYAWSDQPGQPATEPGGGLGNTLIAPNYSVDGRMHIAAGGTMVSEAVLEGLSLSVDGKINSLTILPYFSVLGPGEPAQLPFEITYWGKGVGFASTPEYMGIDPPASGTYGPVNIDFLPDSLPYEVDILPFAVAGEEVPYLLPYLQKYNFPSVTFQFGFSILSLDYTPMSVPEPNSPLLLGSDLLGAGLGELARRRRRKIIRHS